MFLGDKVVLVCVICLSYKVVVAGSEVVLVHRNVTDSFRVGKDGCTSNSSVCPSSSACQRNSGLCLCGNPPNFLNLVNGYKCVSNGDINVGHNGFGCLLDPFQLIPYSHNEPATQFSQPNAMTSCSLRKNENNQVKFPNITNNMELEWLDDSYVQFSVSFNTLSFKWKKSVPGLRGAIIILHLRCLQGGSSVSHCLRAKVFGTWQPDQNPIEPPVLTAEPTSAPTDPTAMKSSKPSSIETTERNTLGTISATADVNPSASTARPPTLSVHNARPPISSVHTARSPISSVHTARTPTSSVHSSPPRNASGSDDDSSGTIIIIAVVVPVVLMIIVVAVLWWMCKRRRQNKQRNSCRGRPSRKKDVAEGKELTQRRSSGTKSSSAVQSNYGYSAADDLPVIAEANPTYDATPSTARKQATQDIAYPTEPDYATPNLERVQARAKNEREEVDSHYYSTLDDNFKGKEDDAHYSMPDIERVDVNGDMYALPDKSKEKKKKEIAAHYCSTPENNVKSKENTAPYSKPDIKRVEVNGDMYALPDINEKNKKGKRLDYLDPSQLYSDTQDKSKTSAQSGESTLYAEIVEAVKSPQKKKK